MTSFLLHNYMDLIDLLIFAGECPQFAGSRPEFAGESRYFADVYWNIAGALCVGRRTYIESCR